MLGKVALAAFLAVHAAIHVSFVTPAPPATAGGPQWPFDTGRSWLLGAINLDPSLMRAIGVVLVVSVIVSYGGAALSLIGAAPSWLFAAGVVAGSLASLVLLVTFFNIWFVLGVAIDLLLLWLMLGNWSPETA